jgi:hypothetical protein
MIRTSAAVVTNTILGNVDTPVVALEQAIIVANELTAFRFILFALFVVPRRQQWYWWRTWR